MSDEENAGNEAGGVCCQGTQDRPQLPLFFYQQWKGNALCQEDAKFHQYIAKDPVSRETHSC